MCTMIDNFDQGLDGRRGSPGEDGSAGRIGATGRPVSDTFINC